MAESRYLLIQDDDCHWYVIPALAVDDFMAWEHAQINCENWTGHDYSENRVNGPHTVTFSEWEESD